MSEENPKYLYKYIPLPSQGKRSSNERPEQLRRALNIISSGYIYAARIAELNDPLEGQGVISYSGYAGCGMAINNERTPSRFRQNLTALRVVSLTTNPVSPQMWAHYANGYQGIAVQIDARQTSADCRPVAYLQEPRRVRGANAGPSSNSIEDVGIFTKQADWSYEREWRVVTRAGECGEYVSFGDDNPSAVILGHRSDPDYARDIIETCRRLGRPVYRTYIADWSYAVRIVPWDFELVWTGESLERQVARACEERGIPNLLNG